VLISFTYLSNKGEEKRHDYVIVLLLKAKDLLFGIIHAVLISIFIKMIKIN